jgi:hypothetical protein
LYASKARAMLESILPYLREKREQVVLILTFDPKIHEAKEFRERLSALQRHPGEEMARQEVRKPQTDGGGCGDPLGVASGGCRYPLAEHVFHGNKGQAPIP